MFKWLTQLIPNSTPSAPKEANVLLSITILLAEIIHSNHVFSSNESSLITGILSNQYALDDKEELILLEKADRQLQRAVSLQMHTSYSQ